MLFSILIAHYNNSRYLGQALDSVFRQTYSDWEIILVDDASKDNFEEVITAYCLDPRIKIFRNRTNKGCGFTKRRCAGLASGKLLGFLDPDDALEVDALSRMVSHHLENKEVVLFYSTHYICDASLIPMRIAEYVRALPDGISYLELSDGRIHHFASFKKWAYDLSGGISGSNKMAVDQDLYYRLEETGKIGWIPEPLYYYRIHNGGISTTGNEATAALWNYRIIQEACLRRISKLNGQLPEHKRMKKIYRSRYQKIRAFAAFREKKWGLFLKSLLLFPMVGGYSNMVDYLKKLPMEKSSLLKKSFKDNYEIRI